MSTRRDHSSPKQNFSTPCQILLGVGELDAELLRRGDDFVFVEGPGFAGL